MGLVYYDESGEYDQQGTLLNMTIGACVSTTEKWKAFEVEWRSVLEREGLHCFHMTEFEAWVPPFDFKLPDGGRDKKRHNHILNCLLDIMTFYIEGFHGFGAVSQFNPGVSLSGPIAHWSLMRDCANGAMKHTVLQIAEKYPDPLSLVFAKQEHVPKKLIHQYLDVYAWGPLEFRIKNVTTAYPKDIIPLQAADLLAYEFGRAQRKDRPERYPYKRLVEGARQNGSEMTMYWGPVSSSTLVIS